MINEEGEDHSNPENSEQEEEPYIPKPRKQFDLKKLWLKDTDDLLEKFEAKYKQVKHEQKGIEEGFKKFEEN